MKKRTKLITVALATCMFLNSALTKVFAEPKFVKLEQNEVKSLNYSKSVYLGDVRSNHGRTGFDAEARINVGDYNIICKIKYIDSNKIEYYKLEDSNPDNIDEYNFYLDINDTIVLSIINKHSWFEGNEESAFLSPYNNKPVIADFKQEDFNEHFAFCSVNTLGGEMWGYKKTCKVIAYSRTATKINFDGSTNYFIKISGDKNHQYNWIAADKLKLSEKEILALPIEDADAICFNEIKNGEWYEIPANRMVVLENLDADYHYNRDFLKLEPGSVVYAYRRSNSDLITPIPEWGYVSLKGLKKVNFPFGYEKKANSQEMVFLCLTDSSNTKIKVYSQPSEKSKILGNLDKKRGKKEKKDILFDLVGCSTESQTINGKTSKWYYIDAPLEGQDKIVRGWVFGPEFAGSY